jgi:hypothetical protein
VFKTPKDFNEAYDARDAERLNWRNKTMVLAKEDLELLEEEFNEGAFDDGSKEAIAKTLVKIKRALEAEKMVFVY